ncbi:MAG: YfhO family protein [Bacteroidetes bacterium]|nr:YfhO family protein [Bacteroidota bacterium]
MKFKAVFPHVCAVVIFTVISFLYFYPVLEGKILRANDSMVFRISSKEIVDYREKTGEEALWTNSMFSGMPAYLISTKYPGNLFKTLDIALRAYKVPVAAVFLAMTGFYILLLAFGVNPWLAITGSLAYGLSSFLFQILAAGHNTQAMALAYMAPVLGSIYYSYRHNAIKGALLLAVFLSLEIMANHPQVTYYAMMCILVFIIIEFIYSVKEKMVPKFIKTSLIIIIPVVLAIGINFGFLYNTYEYGKYSIRGKSELTTETGNASSGLDRDYIVQWSYGIGETFNMLIPNFKGGSSAPFDRDSKTVYALRQNNAASAAGQLYKYWGPQPITEGPHYTGAVVIFLFALGLIIVKGREKWWLLIATILSVMLAWGKNFMPLTNFFIDFFPGYNKFRAVTMILIIAQFCIPLLGILALKNILEEKQNKKNLLKALKIITLILSGLILLVIIIPGIAGSFLNPYEEAYPDWLKNAMIADRKSLLIGDAIRSLIFILLASAALFGFLSGKIKKKHMLIVTALLIVIDLWTADKRYLNADRFEKPVSINKTLTPSVADAAILQDPSCYRVLNLAAPIFSDNTPTSYFHKSIGGYHGAKIRRYQELIDSSLYKECDMIQKAIINATTTDELLPVYDSARTLNMLNAKYIIYNPEAQPLINSKAMGNAWFVEEAVMVNDANEEIISLNTIDPRKKAVINTLFKDQITKSSYPVTENDTIELLSYQPNELVYKYSASSEKLVVFSEIYYPAGWKCFIDGQASDHFRANYVLRAMTVPEGTHEIRFVFEPDSYHYGNRVSLASSIILILLLAGALVVKLRKK